MKGKVKKQESMLNGVKCVVNTCYYYGEGDCCMASQIEIQPRNARNSHETDCSTFTPIAKLRGPAFYF